jgi:hypothetical protein
VITALQVAVVTGFAASIIAIGHYFYFSLCKPEQLHEFIDANRIDDFQGGRGTIKLNAYIALVLFGVFGIIYAGVERIPNVVDQTGGVGFPSTIAFFVAFSSWAAMSEFEKVTRSLVSIKKYSKYQEARIEELERQLLGQRMKSEKL